MFPKYLKRQLYIWICIDVFELVWNFLLCGVVAISGTMNMHCLICGIFYLYCAVPICTGNLYCCCIFSPGSHCIEHSAPYYWFRTTVSWVYKQILAQLQSMDLEYSIIINKGWDWLRQIRAIISAQFETSQVILYQCPIVEISSFFWEILNNIECLLAAHDLNFK